MAVDNKKIRKLDRREHDRTRELYEAVFPEDSQLFVDYYYDQVADENEIYVVEKEEEICAMLHLNPYEVHLDGDVYPLHYIVAVGTRQEYRHQGMMKSLLKASLHEMYERKEPFTFLMPADEAIYRPFGFGYFSEQNFRTVVPKEYRGCPALECFLAEMADVPDLAWEAVRILKEKYRVYARRTEGYFARLLDEQEAQRGEVVVLAKERAPKGYLVYSAEDARVEIRELVVEPGLEEEVLGALSDWFFYDEQIKVYGFPEKLENEDTVKKPLMMGRIVHLEAFLESLKSDISIKLCFSITDEMIPENTGSYEAEITPFGGKVRQLEEMEVQEKKPEKLELAELLGRLLPKESIFLHETV